MLRIRGWLNLIGCMTLLLTYMNVYNVVNPKGYLLYAFIGFGVLLLLFVVYSLYRSTDEQQLRTQIKHHKEDASDIFEAEDFTLLVESSKEPINHLSSAVRETCGEKELQQMLDLLAAWKKENEFVWDKYTLYDNLCIIGDVDGAVKYEVLHKVYTKNFKITGEIIQAEPPKNTELLQQLSKHKLDCKKLYTINGLYFHLVNVQPNDLGKTATLHISINTNYPFESPYVGIITDRLYNAAVDSVPNKEGV